MTNDSSSKTRTPTSRGRHGPHARDRPRLRRRFSHDEFFRFLLSDPKRLTAFVRAALPADIVSALDLDHPEPQDTTFVDDATKRRVCDMLWRVPFKDILVGQSNEGPVPPGGAPPVPWDEAPWPNYVFILFEHKSTRDPDIIFQLLEMMLKIWDKYRAQVRQQRRTGTSDDGRPLPPEHLLPFILPVVVSNQRGKWDLVEQGFRSQFGEDEELLEFVPTVPIFHLSLEHDLTLFEERLGDQDRDLMAGLGAMVLTARKVDETGLRKVLDIVAQGSWAQGDKSLASALLEYVTHGKIDIDPKRMVKLARDVLGQPAEEEMTTYVQAWMQQGFEKGIQEGRQKGLQEGRQDMVLRVLAKKFGELSPDITEEIRSIHSEDLLANLLLDAAQAPDMDAFLAALEALRH